MSIPLLYDQGPSDDHSYSSSPAAIAAESSQHHLSLLVSASSVTTTTVVTVRNLNTASVDLSSVYTEAGAPINSFITTVYPSSHLLGHKIEIKCYIF